MTAAARRARRIAVTILTGSLKQRQSGLDIISAGCYHRSSLVLLRYERLLAAQPGFQRLITAGLIAIVIVLSRDFNFNFGQKLLGSAAYCQSCRVYRASRI